MGGKGRDPTTEEPVVPGSHPTLHSIPHHLAAEGLWANFSTSWKWFSHPPKGDRGSPLPRTGEREGKRRNVRRPALCPHPSRCSGATPAPSSQHRWGRRAGNSPQQGNSCQPPGARSSELETKTGTCRNCWWTERLQAPALYNPKGAPTGPSREFLFRK